MAHVHSHGSDDISVSPKVRRALLLVTIPVVVVAVFGLAQLRPTGEEVDAGVLGQPVETADAVVTAAPTVDCQFEAEGDLGATCQTIEIRVTSGPGEGETGTIDYQVTGSTNPINEGDRIVVSSFLDLDGRAVYAFIDYQRRSPMVVLAVIFVAAVLALGRWRGLRALVALAVSLGVLVAFTIPAVVEGRSPLLVSLVTAVVVMLVVLYVTDGPNVRATVAVLGTVASLALIALLAGVFVELTHLTGLASEEAGFIQASNSQVNIQGLLLGGFIIGALGVLDDMTVTQVSAVWELHQANAALGVRDLYRAAERIGRDHIGSTVNTLVLAYAGASLPLLILFTQSNQPIGSVLTSEVVAVEIVRTLVGSIGLVASVPITTALAAFVIKSGASAPS